MSAMFSVVDVEGMETVEEGQEEEMMDFEKFYNIVTNGTHQKHSRVVSDLVNETIRDTVTFVFLEAIQWQHRMAFYSSSFLGRRLILDMPLVKPKRSTLEALKALSIFKQSALSATSGKTTVHSVALWLDNVASDDERSFFHGFCSLLSKLRLDLQAGNQGRSVLQDVASDDEDDLPLLPLPSASDSSESHGAHGDTHLRAMSPIRNVRSDSDEGQGIEMQEPVGNPSSSGKAPVDLPVTSSKSGSSLWKVFKLGMKSTTRDMSDRPKTVESADTHSLSPPVEEDAWPDAPDIPIGPPDHSSDDDDALFDLDGLTDTSPHQTAEIPTAEPAPALLKKRRAGNEGQPAPACHGSRPRLSVMPAPIFNPSSANMQ
jgi:hypothetical protein